MGYQPIDMVILTYNRQRYCAAMLEAVRQYTDYPHRIIVVDNGSDAEMQSFLRTAEQNGHITRLVLNENNEFMHGWRHGIRLVESPFFALSDPDIVVPALKPCWLTRMVQCFEQFPELARLGTALSIENIPPCWDAYQARFLALQTGKVFCRKPLLRLCTPDTTLQLIRTESFRLCGGFEADCIDFKWLKQLRGYGICVVHNEVVSVHLGWNEYRDYPDYLREKNRSIKPYREVSLIEGYSE